MAELILNKTLTDFETELTALGYPAYRARQVYAHALKGKEISEMHNIPGALRDALSAVYYAQGARIHQCLISSRDGTEKYLYKLHDGVAVEGVWMQYRHGATLCLSTQAGCRMGCAFCASTVHGLERNLSGGEMLCEVIAAMQASPEKDAVRRRVNNIVLMGSGEPLDNYSEVIKFLRSATEPWGLNIGARHISLSTCGLPDGIRALALEGIPITLSLSLHAPDDVLRTQLMPIAKQYGIDSILAALDFYNQRTKRRSIIEYILIRGVNDSVEQAHVLARRLQSRMCHVNLIPFNRVDAKAFLPPDAGQVQRFLQVLLHAGISATLRRSLGQDISGACGQLRNRVLEGVDAHSSVHPSGTRSTE